jgi:hypothetical protein
VGVRWFAFLEERKKCKRPQLGIAKTPSEGGEAFREFAILYGLLLPFFELVIFLEMSLEIMTL